MLTFSIYVGKASIHCEEATSRYLGSPFQFSDQNLDDRMFLFILMYFLVFACLSCMASSGVFSSSSFPITYSASSVYLEKRKLSLVKDDYNAPSNFFILSLVFQILLGACIGKKKDPRELGQNHQHRSCFR